MNPGTWGIVISGVLAIGGIAGTILSRIGKKGDQELQSFTDQYQRMLGENQYLSVELQRERDGRAKDKIDAEGRWTRQIDRCRGIADSAAQTITRLMRTRPEPDEAGEKALRDIADHNSTDHLG